MTAEILSIGGELMAGRIADTNAAFLSEQLARLGFQVMRHTVVGDREGDILAALARIAVGVVSAEVRIADALAVDAALARLALVIVAAQSARPALPVDAIEAW